MREEWGTKNPKKRRNCTKNRQICGLRTACVRDGLKTAVFRGSLYFVVETKSSLFDEDLRDREGGKIKCGTAHFKALAVGENPAVYGKFTDVDGLLAYETR